MRRTLSHRPLVLTIVSVTCGLLALIVATSAVERARSIGRSGYVTAAVAARALDEGAVVTPKDVRTIEAPPEVVPSGRAQDPVGRTVTIAMVENDWFFEAKLSPSGRGISALLRPDEVAATIAPTTRIAVAPGESVRVTATFDPQRFKVTRDTAVTVIAPRARVLSVDAKDGQLTLALRSAERDLLARARGNAVIDIALLPPGG